MTTLTVLRMSRPNALRLCLQDITALVMLPENQVPQDRMQLALGPPGSRARQRPSRIKGKGPTLVQRWTRLASMPKFTLPAC